MERAFFSVPTSFLEFDPDASRNPGKMDPVEMRKAMASVPDLYRMRLAGYSDADFRNLRAQPATELDHLRGSTYANLFTSLGQPLRAEFIDGKGLVVTAGQHRALEAKRIGVPYLPMHVTLPDSEHLVRVREACETEVSRLTPDMAELVGQDRALDTRLYPAREGSDFAERQGGPESREPVRDPGWRNPEVDRDFLWREGEGRSER
jgi:hypothetical protein